MTQSIIMNAFIREIDRIRRERGLNQQQLAELLGTKQGNVSRLLRGEENPTIERCEEIAAKLGLEIRVQIVELEAV